MAKKKAKKKSKKYKATLRRKRKKMKRKMITARRKKKVFDIRLAKKGGGSRIVSTFAQKPLRTEVKIEYGPRGGVLFNVIAVTQTGRREVVWTGQKCPPKPFIKPRTAVTLYKRTVWVPKTTAA